MFNRLTCPDKSLRCFLFWVTHAKQERLSICLNNHHGLQSSVVITRSNLSRYHTQHCDYSSRTWNRLGAHNRHPYLALTGELWGVYCEHIGANWPPYNGIALYQCNWSRYCVAIGMSAWYHVLPKRWWRRSLKTCCRSMVHVYVIFLFQVSLSETSPGDSSAVLLRSISNSMSIPVTTFEKVCLELDF